MDTRVIAKKVLNDHFIFLKIAFIHFYREGEREREGEKHQCVVASHVPPTGHLAHNSGCALTGNQTGDPLALNPLSHTSQG